MELTLFFFMVELRKCGIIFFFLVCSIYLFAQTKSNFNQGSLMDLRNTYANFEENDEKAIPHVKNYLLRAKNQNDYHNIFQAYKDLIFYTKDRNKKIVYADSCVLYSLKSNDNELISNAYLTRGIIYYFFFKKYQPALDEYLKAYKYSTDIKDEYLKNTIIYHLGVVKSYLGYYDEALNLFTRCVSYFENIARSDAHPITIFNNQKGYFNSLHQQAVCYRNIHNYKKSDSIIGYALANLPKSNDFVLEKSYFLKCLGISEYRKGNYNEAIKNLSNALTSLTNIDDFSWASVCYFYIGKSYLQIHEEKKALSYLTKVDSIFQKRNFILPEVRENYEILIDHYHKSGNPQKELYFTKQLLKADNILGKDFKYLSSKINREYETKTLLDKQIELESKNSNAIKLLLGSVAIIAVLSAILFYRNKKQRAVQKQYLELEQKLIKEQKGTETIFNENQELSKSKKENKNTLAADIIADILRKLEAFENKKEFRKKGLTLSDLSKRFNTNTAYLSQVINEYKGNNFNTYLNTLRIEYITHELYQNPKFLEYTIEGLANDCGMSSRQTFTALFSELNGIKPTSFIKKRKEEINKI
ncbi:tetratricopeptide repeat protein [Chryseobacterium sp. ON_d1]|uniref:tetratricopeptide repeat protein n=1 Tax=Chryseobacterium sp. ON_d1 TaxID=2583211 RepID=UPI001158437C|nr:tetratricopeptide repeat protein [Chryseobacterium sp. ON_d1]